MLIAEDVALLLTDDATGRALVDARRLDLALAGGLLHDLVAAGLALLTGRGEEVRPGRVVLTGAHPIGDPLLDGGAARLDAQKAVKPRDALKALDAGLRPAVYGRLVERGIVRASQSRVLGVFPSSRWPALDSAHESRVRGALRDVLVVGRPPTAVEAALISLLHAVGQVGAIVEAGATVETGVVPRGEVVRRARGIAQGDPVGLAVASAAASSGPDVAAVIEIVVTAAG